MADHTADADHSRVPDYDLAEHLELARPEQYRALFEPTRQQIVSLLLERAATTSELAVALDKPKGTVGHHVKSLEDAGLVRIVRTKRVRAIEAKYYGRTARVFLFHRVGEARSEPQRMLTAAAAEIGALPEGHDLPQISAVRYARIPVERAEEWRRRLAGLIDEFVREPRGGEVTFGFLAGIYPTDRPRLPEQEAEK
jgi:DNA-binding transcriptional ArsR family regulator